MNDAAAKPEQAGEVDASAALAPSGQEWAFGIRTCGPKGESYNGFVWPLEAGAVARCDDFNTEPVCGYGLHLNPWGLGDWSLHSVDPAARWLLVKYDPALAIDLDGGEGGGKVKAPWAIVEAVETSAARVMARISAQRHQRITALAGPDAMTSGDRAHAATSGDRAHAATSGYGAHAAASGEASIAAALGGFGARAKAGAGGAIMLAEHAWDEDARKMRLLAVFASKVGENGIEPEIWYELKGGKPVAVEPEAVAP